MSKHQAWRNVGTVDVNFMHSWLPTLSDGYVWSASQFGRLNNQQQRPWWTRGRVRPTTCLTSKEIYRQEMEIWPCSSMSVTAVTRIAQQHHMSSGKLYKKKRIKNHYLVSENHYMRSEVLMTINMNIDFMSKVANMTEFQPRKKLGSAFRRLVHHHQEYSNRQNNCTLSWQTWKGK